MPPPSFIPPTPARIDITHPELLEWFEDLSRHSDPDVRHLAGEALQGDPDALWLLADWFEEQGDLGAVHQLRSVAASQLADATPGHDIARFDRAREEPGVDPEYTRSFVEADRAARMHNASRQSTANREAKGVPPIDHARHDPPPRPDQAGGPAQYARSRSMSYPYSRPAGPSAWPRRADGSIPPDTRPILRYARGPHLHPQEYEGEEDQPAGQPAPQGPSGPPVPEPGSPRSPLWRGATQPNLDRWVNPRDVQAARERPENREALRAVQESHADEQTARAGVTFGRSAVNQSAYPDIPAPVGRLPRDGPEGKPLTQLEGQTHLDSLLAILDDLAEDVARGEMSEEEAWQIREQILQDWQRSRRDLMRRTVPHWSAYEAAHGTHQNNYERQIMESARHPNWDPQEDVFL